MDRQAIFNTIATHLLTQKSKSLDPSVENGLTSNCRYRSPDGKKCAIGCLIKDEHYTPELEGKGVNSALVKHALKLSLVDDPVFEDIDFLRNLQEIHDLSEPCEWRDRLVSYGSFYGCSMPEGF